jgi:hypothetical protein
LERADRYLPQIVDLHRRLRRSNRARDQVRGQRVRLRRELLHDRERERVADEESLRALVALEQATYDAGTRAPRGRSVTATVGSSSS